VRRIDATGRKDSTGVKSGRHKAVKVGRTDATNYLEYWYRLLPVLELRSNSLTSIYSSRPACKAISASSGALPERDKLMAAFWSRLISRPHPSQLNFSFSVAGFRYLQ